VNYIQSTIPFNGHICYIGQFAPFSSINFNQALDGLKFVQQKLNYHKPIKYNFYLGSSQYSNFSTCDCRFDLPFEVRYEIMVTNVVAMAKQFNFVPCGLYHVADFDCQREWVNNVLTKISLGSIIISNQNSCIYENVNTLYPGNYGHLIFTAEEYHNYIHTNEIRKLISHGKYDEVKKHLPPKTIEIMSKYGLL
jgi:hypothetical protein